MKCFLCGKDKELKNSHIAPKFVYKWLKEISPAGKMRSDENPRMRVQDGTKKHLLCNDCEILFSKWEKKFSESVFRPYVDEVLDELGVVRSYKQLIYNESILKFIISLQFRVLLSEGLNGHFDHDLNGVIDDTIITWKKYLLSESTSTGENRSYIFFLGMLMNSSHMKNYELFMYNYFVHKSSFTDIYSNYKSGMFGILSKLGPVVIYTSLRPLSLNKMDRYSIRKKGILTLGNRMGIPHKELYWNIFDRRYKKFRHFFGEAQKQLNFINNKGDDSKPIKADHLSNESTKVEIPKTLSKYL